MMIFDSLFAVSIERGDNGDKSVMYRDLCALSFH